MTTAALNPPHLTRIPQRFLGDPQAMAYFEENETFKRQLYDILAKGNVDLSFPSTARVTALSELFNKDNRFTEYYIDADHDTSGWERVTLNATATVTLNDDPDNGETVVIYISGDYTLTLTGSHDISGKPTRFFENSSQTISVRYDGIEGEWYIVSGYIESIQKRRIVKTIEDIAVNTSSDVIYLVDGIIDAGSASIVVPVGGLNIQGLSGTFSKLSGSGDGVPLFVSAVGGCGNFTVADVNLEASGAGSKVFDLTGATGSESFGLNSVGFTNSTSLGEITGFSQGFCVDLLSFGCADGFTLSGSWSGGFVCDGFLVRFFGSSGTLFKNGTSLTLSSRFVLSANIDLPAGTSSVSDLSASNFNSGNLFNVRDCIVTRSGAQDANDANYFPNITEENSASLWKNNTGLLNTAEGSSWNLTAEAVTTIGTIDTWVKVAGTTTYSNEEHFSDTTSNAAICDDASTKKYMLISSGQIEGASGDVIKVGFRIYRSATASYEDGQASDIEIQNLPGPNDRLTYSISDKVQLKASDRVELWCKNLTAARDVTLVQGARLDITVI